MALPITAMLLIASDSMQNFDTAVYEVPNGHEMFRTLVALGKTMLWSA